MKIKTFPHLINVCTKRKCIGTVRIKTTYVIDDAFRVYDVNLDDYYGIKRQLEKTKGKVEWQIAWFETDDNVCNGDYDLLKPIQFAYKVYLYSDSVEEQKAIETIARIENK